MNFQEAAEGSQAPWENGDYNTITKVAPVLIFDIKKNRNHTCSTIDMDAAKERFKHDTGKKGVDFPGWCATEVRICLWCMVSTLLTFNIFQFRVKTFDIFQKMCIILAYDYKNHHFLFVTGDKNEKK